MLRDQVHDLLQRVPLVPESEARVSRARSSNQDAAARIGINIEPGHDDDGWDAPEPVYLDDGTRLQLYKDGEAADAAIRAIENAKKRILLEVYIWPTDETGERFSEAMAKKAEEGVRVFAIYDSFGCLLTKPVTFDRMRHAGVNLLEFHPLNPWRSRWGWRPANRDHRKLLVVDDDVAGIGGLNIGNRYAGSWVAPEADPEPGDMWRDAGIGIVGPAAKELADAFSRTWRYIHHRGPIRRTLYSRGIEMATPAKGRRLGKSREAELPEPNQGPEAVLASRRELGFIASAPTLSSPLRPFLHQLIGGASRSIVLTMGYFAPDDALIRELCDAARRGVRVQLMLAGKSDVKLVITAARAFYAKLLNAGCDIYERQGAMLHQKSIVVDNEVTVLGSTNLDYRSIEFNLEISGVVRSREFATQTRALFDHDTQWARRIEPEEWRDRPYRDKFIQWLVSRLRYAL